MTEEQKELPYKPEFIEIEDRLARDGGVYVETEEYFYTKAEDMINIEHQLQDDFPKKTNLSANKLISLIRRLMAYLNTQ